MEHLGKSVDCTASDRDVQQGMLTLSISTLPVEMIPMVGTSWHQLWSVKVCGTPREGGRLHCQRSWCPTGDAYTVYINITCRDDPHGRYIMTSAMVCSSVWNTSGSGSTALPAIVMSNRGCFHYRTNITWNYDPHGRYIMTSAMVCSNVWKTSGSGSTVLPAIVMSDRGCLHCL